MHRSFCWFCCALAQLILLHVFNVLKMNTPAPAPNPRPALPKVSPKEDGLVPSTENRSADYHTQASLASSGGTVYLIKWAWSCENVSYAIGKQQRCI